MLILKRSLHSPSELYTPEKAPATILQTRAVVANFLCLVTGQQKQKLALTASYHCKPYPTLFPSTSFPKLRCSQVYSCSYKTYSRFTTVRSPTSTAVRRRGQHDLPLVMLLYIGSNTLLSYLQKMTTLGHSTLDYISDSIRVRKESPVTRNHFEVHHQ